MTREEAQKLPLGIYLIFWTSGGMSKAIVQQSYNGERIISCHNWTSAGGAGGAKLDYYVPDIEKMIFIM